MGSKMVNKQAAHSEVGASQKKRLVHEGTVVSTAMDKTIVVRVENRFKHPVMGKIVRSFKKYKAHDEQEVASMGDVVEVVECRPLSATKYMTLVRVVKRHQG
jgi:small subunit ribosomal protein S17